MDRRLRTGVTEGGYLSALDFVEGVGLKLVRFAPRARGLLDCLGIKLIEELPIVK